MRDNGIRNNGDPGASFERDPSNCSEHERRRRRSRSLLINGIRLSAATEPKPSAKDLGLVLSTDLDRRARFPAVMG